jgi:signal transduction histidine kinase/CheY-like chemotaxis protein/ligand-binding sensor domain-containing protein
VRSFLISIFACFLLLLLSCKQQDREINTNVPKTDQFVISFDGDTIQSGVPVERKGRVVSAKSLTEPLNIPVSPEVIPEELNYKEYPIKLIKSVPLPKGDTIYFGKNGVPFPKKEKLKVEKVRALTPEPITALPFFKKSIEDGAKEYLTMKQGLASSSINEFEVDDNGFIWMASNQGLIRYDGKSFRNYIIPGLPRPEIFDIARDSDGNIWLAGEGIIKFDGEFFYIYKWSNGKPIDNSREINFDANGILWVRRFEPNSILKFDGQVATIFGEEEGSVLNYFGGKFMDPQGKLWIWNQNSLNEVYETFIIKYVIPGHSDLSYLNAGYDPKTNTLWISNGTSFCIIEQGHINYYTTEILEKDTISYMAIDNEGQLVMVHQSGAMSPLKEAYIQYYKKEEAEKTGLISSLGVNRWANKRKINGEIWFAKNEEGIIRYDPDDFRVFTFPINTFPINHIQHPFNPYISAIMEDAKGNIWFGTHSKALVKYNGNNFILFPEISNHAIFRQIYEDSKGVIWIASFSGLLKYDGNNFTSFPLEDNSKTNKGVSLKTDKTVRTITEDGEGNMWFGSVENGLVKYDGNDFIFYINKNDAFNNNIIRAMITDRKGNIWIGYHNIGLVKYDGKTFTLFTEKEGLNDKHIASLFEDSKGNIWIGTQYGGVSKLTQREGQNDDVISFTNYTIEDGLTRNDIWTISEDSKGNIWLGAGGCLNLLFIDEQQSKLSGITEYCDLGGVMGAEFFSNATLLDSKNRMWWGTNKELIVAEPEKFYIDTIAPKVFLDGLELNQTFVDFKQLSVVKEEEKDYWVGQEEKYNLASISYSGVPQFFNYPQDLKLPYDINSLTFQFSATNARDLSDVKFSYFLEGHDKDWSKPTKEYKTDYRGLSHGTYTFKVKAVGNNQVWSAPVEYTFTITPPWWLTWWAYLAYFVITAGVLYFFWRLNLRRSLELAETKRVKELDSLKTRLYTNITHEFRTPLTVIMGMSENIKEHPNERKLIRRNSKNLLRLVNQLLDLSKLESGNLKLDKIQGDIVNYLQYLTESFYSMATEKDIRLTFYSEEEELIMDYDEVKIQHIIYNLLSNAIKFTPKGGKVILHLRQIEQNENPQLKLKVKDNGIGITAEKLPHVFDRFYQADDSATRSGEGTGIGLTLVKELVEMMGGRISVESTLHKGTEFTIWLPVKREVSRESKLNYDEEHFHKMANELVPVKTNSTPIKIPPVTDEHKPEILIIEDNKDVVTYIETLLQRDYTVHIAVDGQKGIDAAIELIPDIIISDVMMPEKDGYEVCETLKQDMRTSHIPIILLTAKAEQSDKVQGLKYGADAYLTKPFDKEELFIRLKKLIELRRQLQTYYANTFSIVLPEISQDSVAPIEDKFIQKLQGIIHDNIGDAEFGVSELGKAAMMSHIQLYRKLKALTDKTPSIFIRSIRLQKAMDLLKNSNLNISEIAYDVGFSDPNYFSKTFHQEFGKPPRSIRDDDN